MGLEELKEAQRVKLWARPLEALRQKLKIIEVKLHDKHINFYDC
jgi:hypothetical protein